MPGTRSRSKTASKQTDQSRKDSPARKLRVLMENIPAPQTQTRNKHSAGKRQETIDKEKALQHETNSNPTTASTNRKRKSIDGHTPTHIDPVQSDLKDSIGSHMRSQRRQSKKISYKEKSDNDSLTDSESNSMQPKSRSRKRISSKNLDTSNESDSEGERIKRKSKLRKSIRYTNKSKALPSDSSEDEMQPNLPLEQPLPAKLKSQDRQRCNSTKLLSKKSCPLKLSPKKGTIRHHAERRDVKPHGEAVKVLLQTYEKPSTSNSEAQTKVMSGSDESDDDWEEVADVVHSSPKKDVKVTVEDNSKGKKKRFDWAAYGKRLWNRFQKEQHEAMHNIELMCLLVRGQWINQLCSEGLLKAVSLSLYAKPNTLRGKSSNLTNISKILDEISTKCKLFKLKSPFKHDENGTDIDRLGENVREKPTDHLQVVALLVSVFRHLGCNVRLIQSLYPREYRITHYKKAKRKKQQEKLRQDNSGKGDKAATKTKNEVKEQFWLEVYLKDEKRWLAIDASFTTYEQYTDLEKRLQLPIRYVLSYDNEGGVKEIIQKYDSCWMTSTRKLRTKQDWWDQTLQPYLSKTSQYSREEDQLIQDVQEKMPFPKSIGEFKNHPLYALERHLLKFEAIYPPTAVPLGYTKTKTNEAIYARECVKQLHSRETWLKEAKQVKVEEKPYKYVKPRPRWKDVRDKIKITEATLPVFGEWQTEKYVPPTAQNGKVPRNPYGNVELFQPEMLPKGCVHIPIDGIGKLCRRLDIDCAQAMMGWDAHSGCSFPQFDGWVICSEFEDTVMDAWKEFEAEQKLKAEAKREKRIYGNWRTLIKGLLIRQRLRNRYGEDTF